MRACCGAFVGKGRGGRACLEFFGAFVNVLTRDAIAAPSRVALAFIQPDVVGACSLRVAIVFTCGTQISSV